MERYFLIEDGSGCIAGDSADQIDLLEAETFTAMAGILDALLGRARQVYSFRDMAPSGRATGYHVYVAGVDESLHIGEIVDRRDEGALTAVVQYGVYQGFVEAA